LRFVMAAACVFYWSGDRRSLPSFPTRRSSDLLLGGSLAMAGGIEASGLSAWLSGQLKLLSSLAFPLQILLAAFGTIGLSAVASRSEEHTSELQSRENLVCRLLLETKKVHHAAN